jgi:hypothetical protein
VPAEVSGSPGQTKYQQPEIFSARASPMSFLATCSSIEKAVACCQAMEAEAEGTKSSRVTDERARESIQSEAPLDVIASFAGPALFGQLAFACRSAFDALEGGRSLRRSLELAGWTSEVLGSLGKMEMLEELWTCSPCPTSPGASDGPSATGRTGTIGSRS